MSHPNPYECPRDDRDPARGSTRLIRCLFGLGALWLLTIAARQFLSAVLDPIGLLAGLLLAMIATVVGRVVGTQQGARVLTVTAATLMFTALVRGWIDHPGEERTMWGFACMCSGMLLGAAYPVKLDEISSDETAELTAAPDAEPRRN